MYAIIVNDERELLEFAKEKGFKVFKLEKEDDVTEIAAKIEQKEEVQKSTHKNISDFLLMLGIKPHIKGFKYLKYIFENGLTCEGGITKILYPMVAKSFNTSPSRVERAIRHAIEGAIYDHKTAQLYLKLFGNFNDHPTNYQFIEGCNIYLEDLSKE